MVELEASMEIGDNTIPCCLCGTPVKSNPANMCLNCLKTKVDVTEGIPKQVQIFWCRGCGRYQKPPWVAAELDSPELLSLLLKKIRGLTKIVKLVEAAFVWTEPHSRRLKVRLTIQKEVFSFAVLQQTFIVEFQVVPMQCPDCSRSYTEHVWKAVVQVRQKVKHKRTFFYLEQVLLKHNVCERVIGLKEQTDGLDFYWESKAHAARQLDFLQSVVPIRSKLSKRLISQDDHKNTKNFKFTLFAEIAPICRDDLVCLSPQIASSWGGVSPLMVCYKVTQSLHFVDPTSLKLIDVASNLYWRYPFNALMNAAQLTEFVVLDLELADKDAIRSGKGSEAMDRNPSAIQNKQSKFNDKLALAEVEVAKKCDFGVNDTTYRCSTHLGNLLKVGDRVLGYDLSHANFDDTIKKQKKSLPEVVLVRKTYGRKNRAKNRQWKLKTMKKEGDRPKKGDLQKDAEDMEQFMQDIEEDPELRKEINLYKKTDSKTAAKGKEVKTKERTMSEKSESEASVVGGEKKVGKSKKSKAEKKKKGKGKEQATVKAADEEDLEEAPQVPIEELINEITEEVRALMNDADRVPLPTDAAEDDDE